MRARPFDAEECRDRRGTGLLKIALRRDDRRFGEASALDDDEIVYLVTGSQGETRAALWNMATGTYKGMEIEKGDTVVLSARIIPGNEKAISRLIGHLYKRGANIIEEKRRLVHVSGHASQEDIKIMVETARPKFLVPIHGEYRMLFRHKEFVKNHVAGYSDENIVLIENGDVLEVDQMGARVVEKRELYKTFIDEESSGEIEYEVVRERKKLAYGGAISLVVTMDKKTGQHLRRSANNAFKVSRVSTRQTVLRPRRENRLSMRSVI